MDFFRSREIPSRRSGDTVFRYPVSKDFLAPLLLAGLLGLLSAAPGPLAPYLAFVPFEARQAAGAAATVLALAGALILAAHLRPRHAWLARMTDSGLLVRFRSHRNRRSLSSADLVAVHIPWRDIRSVQHTREPAAKGRDERVTFLDLKLDSDDLLPLRMHLSRERNREPAALRRWWGGRAKRAVVPHHPVGLTGTGVLRLEWKVRPRAGQAVEMLRARLARAHGRPAAPRAPGAEGGERLPGREALERVAELVRTDQPIDAVMEAVDALGLSDSDAQRLVEAMAAGDVTPDNPESATAFLVKPISREHLLGLVERGQVGAVENALVAHYGFSAREAKAIGAALQSLPPDQGRRHLASQLQKGPARTLP
jgi:hypothetical protein